MPCQCAQAEIEKEKLAQLLKYSNLGALSRLTFDNLSPIGRQKEGKLQFNFTQAYEAAKAFAAAPKGRLVFKGPNGCGKTQLAASDDLFERVKNTPLLIMDDLTMTVTTPWAKGKLEQLLNHRFNTQLPTVITTRVPIEELDENFQGHLTDPDFCRIQVIQSVMSSKVEHLEGLELKLLKEMSFKNFDYRRLELPDEQRQHLEQAYRVALNFAHSPQGWLVLLGDNGCGKTHLAAAIANHLRQAGKSVLFIVVPDLLDHLRSAFSPESRVSYDELFEKVKKVPVLVLDDFGEQSATTWAQGKIYQLINYRYNARLATVITTCNTLDEIESRISSRLMDPSLSLVFNIKVPDYRGDRRTNKIAKTQQQYRQRSSKA